MSRILTAFLSVSVLLSLVGPLAGEVQLGETKVPRDRFIIYTFIGHSNMDGCARRRIHESHPRAWRYNPGNDTWSPNKDDGSCIMPFLSKMVEEYPEYHIGAVKVSKSASRIEPRYRKNGGELYPRLIKAMNAAKKDGTLGGLVAMIGFCEAGNKRQAGEFLDQAKGMVHEVRTDVNLPKLPFIIGKYEEGATNIRGFRHIVKAAIYKIPEAIPNAYVVDKDGPYVDGHHYNAIGHRIWAHEAVRLIKANRIFPFAPPVRVTLNAPEQNRIVSPGEAIVLRVEAEADEGSVKKVEFFGDGKKLGEASSTPYAFTWSGAKKGIHRVHAVGYDDKGNHAASAARTVAVGKTPTALMVAGSDALGAAEQAVRARMESLGYLVEVRDDDETSAADAASCQLVLIPASCQGLVVRKFHAVRKPVVIWNDYCPELRVTTLRGGAIASKVDSVEIVNPELPLAAGLKGEVRVFKQQQSMRWCKPAENALMPATVAGSKQNKAAVTAFETGSALPRMGSPAPNRRVSLFMGLFAVTELTDAGWRLFDAAIEWAAEGKPLDPALVADAENQTFDAWPGNVRSLGLLWENARAKNKVQSLAGKGIRTCALKPAGRAVYGPQFQMDAAGGYFRVDGASARELLAAARASGELSVEVTIAPAETRQDGTIVAMAAGAEKVNFALGQAGRTLNFRLRTRGTGPAGAKGNLCELPETDKPMHVVFTVGRGDIRAYVNGEYRRPHYSFRRDFSNWEQLPIRFGALAPGTDSWDGRIEGAALYARRMGPKEIKQQTPVGFLWILARKLISRF